MFKGSGGGGGFYNIGADLSSRSGSGGGALIIRTNKIIINGKISVAGNTGKNGEGGGAGGSLIINATYCYGIGNIIANGGDGGYSGGLISGQIFFTVTWNIFFRSFYLLFCNYFFIILLFQNIEKFNYICIELNFSFSLSLIITYIYKYLSMLRLNI